MATHVRAQHCKTTLQVGGAAQRAGRMSFVPDSFVEEEEDDDDDVHASWYFHCCHRLRRCRVVL